MGNGGYISVYCQLSSQSDPYKPKQDHVSSNRNSLQSSYLTQRKSSSPSCGRQKPPEWSSSHNPSALSLSTLSLLIFFSLATVTSLLVCFFLFSILGCFVSLLGFLFSFLFLTCHTTSSRPLLEFFPASGSLLAMFGFLYATPLCLHMVFSLCLFTLRFLCACLFMCSNFFLFFYLVRTSVRLDQGLA